MTRLSAIRSTVPDVLTSALLTIDTSGEGFTEITDEAVQFLERGGAGEGVLLLYLRHTSASLVIQENADPDVQADLLTALCRIAPADGPWVHKVEGPDDMPAHIKAALTANSLSIPVAHGRLLLGTWQGLYLFEHRTTPHRRDIVLHLS
jgi:secondary thiamine-phosphate synthase enzyme